MNSHNCLNADKLPELTKVSPTKSAGRLFTLEKLSRSCRKNRRGTAAVEFAVVAPVFILLVMGMIEYGRAVMIHQVITNASREGARAGVVDGATSSSVQTAVKNYLTAGGLSSTAVNNAKITCNPANPASAGFGGTVTVSVSIPFRQVSWLPTPKFMGAKTLSSSFVMRREAVQ